MRERALLLKSNSGVCGGRHSTRDGYGVARRRFRSHASERLADGLHLVVAPVPPRRTQNRDPVGGRLCPLPAVRGDTERDEQDEQQRADGDGRDDHGRHAVRALSGDLQGVGRGMAWVRTYDDEHVTVRTGPLRELLEEVGRDDDRVDCRARQCRHQYRVSERRAAPDRKVCVGADRRQRHRRWQRTRRGVPPQVHGIRARPHGAGVHPRVGADDAHRCVPVVDRFGRALKGQREFGVRLACHYFDVHRLGAVGEEALDERRVLAVLADAHRQDGVEVRRRPGRSVPRRSAAHKHVDGTGALRRDRQHRHLPGQHRQREEHEVACRRERPAHRVADAVHGVDRQAEAEVCSEHERARLDSGDANEDHVVASSAPVRPLGNPQHVQGGAFVLRGGGVAEVRVARHGYVVVAFARLDQHHQRHARHIDVRDDVLDRVSGFVRRAVLSPISGHRQRATGACQSDLQFDVCCCRAGVGHRHQHHVKPDVGKRAVARQLPRRHVRRERR
mmetsp:Transcript_4218/g.15547  ORF Transcript_4218/g.15547 Transcript_4218/m.15547 type:complete len:504 (+) Transcript_4218:189-1700(+)